MVSYLFKILLVLIFFISVGFLYYLVFPAINWSPDNSAFFSHIMNFDWYSYFLLPFLILYSIYKYFSIINNKKYFSLPEIFWYFFTILFLLSIFFYWIHNFKTIDWQGYLWASTWITLFIKILLYLIIPSIIVISWIALWRKIIKKIWLFSINNWIFNFLISLGLGFFVFMFILTIFWFFWLYNLAIVFLLLLWIFIFSFEEIQELYYWFTNYKIHFTNHNFQEKSIVQKIAFNLLNKEFLFITASIILSINLISIVRPMPIWWDDLGVYMNYPRQMAHFWEINFLSWMYVWQILTWIWFMIAKPTLAFFINNIWWILSFIVIILVTKDLLDSFKKEEQKTFFDIPLFLATIFISLPMVIFQQAKDMKLDEWLFFVSLISLYLSFKLFDKDFIKKENKTKLIFIIWLLASFAFSIKFTSLLLISWILALIFYNKFWFCGFLWYLWLYFAIFTKANLWHYLNVVVEKNSNTNLFSLISAIFWISFLIIWYFKHKTNIKKFLINTFVFFLGIIIALLPWFWKNIYQAKINNKNINLWVLLSWQAKSFKADYTKIHTKEELEKIEKNYKSWLSSSWTTTNEDLGRYFGYEKWINNYLRLPFNITMQINQKWEFTDISMLFLAFIPIIFLFLSYKFPFLSYVNLIFITFEILYFIIPETRIYFTNIFDKLILPFWYIVLFLIAIVPLIFLYFSLKNTQLNKLFKINLIFSFVYIFLFVISAFWIVWYWIVLYYSLLLMIWISLFKIWEYKKNDDKKTIETKLFWSFVIFNLFVIYFFISVFPHVFFNLYHAWYPHYKAWNIEANEALFAYHPEYKTILFNLNIDRNKLAKNQTSISLNQILQPNKNIQNTANIYRIWTFLKYYIEWNYYRLFEDSLVTQFDKYIYDKNSVDNTVENMKKLGFKYLLVDLNAATIDKDPRHNLTNRYEKLLKTFTSNKLQLIETDSICLKLALEDYKKSPKTQKDLQNYMTIAWVNYYSYPEKNKFISPSYKQKICKQRILELIKNNKVDKNNYPYLLNIKSLSSWSKALFLIK